MSLPTTIAEAAFTTHPEWGLVVAGGEVTDDTNKYTDSVVRIHDGKKVESLPALPEPISWGCLVALDKSRLFYGGGRQQGGSEPSTKVSFETPSI